MERMKIKHSNVKPIPCLWEAPINRYLEHMRAGGYPETTIDTRRQHLHFLARRIGADPGEVTPARLVAWCSEQNWAPESRRGRNNSYRLFWRWAEKSGVMTNVAEDLPTVRQRQSIPRPTPDLVYRDAVMNADVRTRLILRLAAEAGLRRSEIAQIRTDRDLVPDFVGHSLIVKGKGEKERIVPLTPGLTNDLQSLEQGWAFPGQISGHLSPRWIGILAKRALKGHWTLHSLRHRFATRAYEIDRDVLGLQELLGHSSPETTRRYVRTDPARLRRVVEMAAQ